MNSNDNLPINKPLALNKSSETQSPGSKLSDCMLNQSSFTVGGILLGTILGSRYKTWVPFISLSGVGTIADLLYGRHYLCKDIHDEYIRSKEDYKNSDHS